MQDPMRNIKIAPWSARTVLSTNAKISKNCGLLVYAYTVTNGNGNHFELREKLFMIIRIGGFAVSLEFDMLGV